MADNPGIRFLIIVPKVAIVRSFVRDLARFAGVRASIYCSAMGHKDLNGQAVVGTWQSLSSAEIAADSFQVIIADEAHRIAGEYEALIARLTAGTARLLGLTATPFRQTGYIYGKDRLFTHVCFARDLRWTTERGFTVPATLKAPPNAATHFDTTGVPILGGDFAIAELAYQALDATKLSAQLRDALPRLLGRQKIVWACVNIAHAHAVCAGLTGMGERACCIVSDSDSSERDTVLGAFTEDAGCRHLTFVSIVAEGFDYAPIDGVVLLRPTRSPTLAIQIIGRGLRPLAGKRDCLVLDYGEVIKNCGPLDQPFVREGRRKSLLEEHDALDCMVVTCQACGAFAFPPKGATEWACAECGECQVPADRDVTKSLREEADASSPLYAEAKAVIKRAEVVGEWTDVIKSLSVTPIGFSKAQQDCVRKVEVECMTRPGAVWVQRDPDHAPSDWSYFKIEWAREQRQLLDRLIADVRSGGHWQLTVVEKLKHGKTLFDYKGHERCPPPRPAAESEPTLGFDFGYET